MMLSDSVADYAARSGRHIVSLSGGKDSTALAIFLRDRIPQLEYVFCDTQKELPETYEYLDMLEAFLGKPIVRLNATRGFDHWLDMHGGMLPNQRVRWCTAHLKIQPFEAFVGDDPVWSYIGIRADEQRSGYISTKRTITPVYPFKDFGIDRAGVMALLEQSGIGLPTYYEWRQRSGCTFCFFQRSIEWVGLLERHPEYFEEAKRYESERGGEHFYWRQRESLNDLERPERIAQIRHDDARRKQIDQEKLKHQPLIELLGTIIDDESDDQGCNICHL